jgi:hypothetical protein
MSKTSETVAIREVDENGQLLEPSTLVKGAKPDQDMMPFEGDEELGVSYNETPSTTFE